MVAKLVLPADIPNHASYLQAWLRKLREDKREVFRAAAAAQHIADDCRSFHPDYSQVSEANDSGHKGDETIDEEAGQKLVA